jgi:hypothetical protein
MSIKIDNIKAAFFEIVNNKDSKVHRITLAALPYIKYFDPIVKITEKPFSRLLIINFNLQKSYSDLTLAVNDARTNKKYTSALWHAENAVVEVAIIISSIASFSLGITLSTIHDMTKQTYEMSQSIKNGGCTKNEVAIFLYKSSTNGLGLAATFFGSPVILISSIAFQVLLEIGQSSQEYKKGRNIEALLSLGLTFIDSYRITPTLKEAYNEWRNPPRE